MRKKAQIWIETVLYTLMGIALIGIVLAIATPRINESRDRILVEQTIESLNVWDDRIGELIDRGQGNVRSIPAFTMKRGELIINSTSDEIIFVVDGLSNPYSEVGFEIREGNIILTSYETERSAYVVLVLKYQNVTNITYASSEENKKFTAASTPYAFSIKNLGGQPYPQIDIEETSRR
jgi:type II secretory pathway pseudopilin PulG